MGRNSHGHLRSHRAGVTAAPRPPLSTPARPRQLSDTIPLPGTATLSIRPAPEREPPYDDERDLEELEPLCPTQQVLPFPPLQPLPPHRPAVAPCSARRAAVPDPAAWARRLLVGVVEVVAGRRPLAQLTGMLSPSVAFGLNGDLRRTSQHRLGSAAVSRVRVCEPADGVAEVSATLRTPSRVHAAALRLEIRRGQWVCTRLMMG